jgi:hypothetical protein
MWTIHETKKLMREEVERYRAAVAKRSWVSKGASADLFYAIEQSGRFDKALRSKLALQLRSKQAALMFAVLMASPASGHEPGVLLRFVEQETVLPHLKMMLPPSNEKSAASLELLIERLTADEESRKAREKSP